MSDLSGQGPGQGQGQGQGQEPEPDVSADSVGPDTGRGPRGDLPEAAMRRLEATSFSSGLSVPDFAACLDIGLQPVALVQGFCVMQWGWYGPGSGTMRGMASSRAS